MSKRFAYWVLGITAIALLLGMFLASPLSTPIMRFAANKWVPGLVVKDISGSLASELTIEQLTFTNESLTANIAQISVNLDWSCLTFSHICIESLQIQQPKLVLTNSAETPAPNSQTAKALQPIKLSLPIEISISSLSVTESKLNLPTMQIELAEFSTQLAVAKRVKLIQPTLDNLIVTPVTTEPEKPFSGLAYVALQLPEFVTPIDVQIEQFKATNIQYGADEQLPKQQLSSVTLEVASLISSTVKWQKLALNHQLGSVAMQGSVKLQQHYPIKLAMQLVADIQEAAEQTVTANLEGNLAKLGINFQAKGLFAGTGKLTANLLDDTLPLRGQLKWPSQIVNYKTLDTVSAGQVDIAGKMGEYQLALSGAVSEQTLGNVAVTAQLLLTNNMLKIAQLDANVLGGRIINRGELNFVEGIYGSGSTRVEQLSLSPLLKQSGIEHLPEQLIVESGEWEYQIGQRESGIELSVTKLSAIIHQAEKQLEIDGQAAFSQRNDLTVASLKINQANSKNQISLDAQLLNNRFVNIQSAIHLPSLSEAIENAQGSIIGTFSVNGEWHNPVFEVSLATDNMVMPQSIVPISPTIGAANLQIDATGEAANHQFNLRFTSAEHSGAMDIKGAWQNKQWVGQIQTAELGFFNTVWEPDLPIDLQIDFDAPAATLSNHCWQLNGSTGTACIAQAAYLNEQASWSLEANKLPLGVWAQAGIAELYNVSDSALLSLVSKGEIDPSGKVKLQAELAVAKSGWTFNQAHPLTVSVDTLRASLLVVDETLSGELAFASPELGAIDAVITTTAKQPFTDTNNIRLTLNNIRLDPLRKISPSLHALGGEINGELAIQGSIKKPFVEGVLQFTNGKIDAEQLPLVINNWEQQISFNQQHATIAGSIQMEEGSATVNGELNWADFPSARLHFAGENILLQYDESKVTVTPNLTTFVSPYDVRLFGEVAIPHARIKIEELPETALSPSKDVYLRGEPVETDPIKQIKTDLYISLDPQKMGDVRVEAFGLTGNLRGGLQVDNQPTLLGYGDLQILQGRYQAYGQNLHIRTGEVQFNGPLSQPFLFVEAIREPDLTEDGVIAGVRIDGAADNPNVSLFSEPSMDQSQNLLYLLNGSGNLGGDSSNDVDYGLALIGFGLARSGEFTSSVGDALGIEDLALTTTGQGDNTVVSVSGRIAKRLTLRYGVAVDTNVSEVALRYQIMPKLYIEAVRNLSNAVDLYYEFSRGTLQPAN